MSKEQLMVEGTVKWYDPEKGYGFVAVEGMEDLFLHRSALEYGETLAEGDRISCDVEMGMKGRNAVRVQILERSGLPPRQRSAPDFRSGNGYRGGNGYDRGTTDVSSLPLVTGTVSRFNDDQGFGFVKPDDGSEDVFVHRSASSSTIAAGDRVEFRLGRGPKGPRAEQLRILDR